MSPLTESTRLTLAKGQPVPNDPYLYTNTVLLLHGDGTNGSTNIVDSSKVAGSPKAVTAVGNAQISTAIADPFGNSTRGVLAFNGLGDYATVNILPSVGTSDYSIECWVYLSNVSTGNFIFTFGDYKQPSGIVLYVNSSGRIGAFGNNALIVAGTTQAVSSTTWTHLAWCRQGTTLRLFVNGVMDGTASNSQDLSNALNQIGRGLYDTNPGGNFNGYIDDLRITKGVARYTSNFTPPTAPFPDF
jgi:hypothetical protein